MRNIASNISTAFGNKIPGFDGFVVMPLLEHKVFIEFLIQIRKKEIEHHGRLGLLRFQSAAARKASAEV